MSNTSALELAQGFHARKFATFTEAMMQENPIWIMGISVHQPADDLPWHKGEKGRQHRTWFCLLVAAAEGELTA